MIYALLSFDRHPLPHRGAAHIPCTTHNLSNMTTMSDTITANASDMILLILGYLTAQGLHHSAQTLRTESGIGYPSHLLVTPNLPSQIKKGEWGSILNALQLYQQQPPFPYLLPQIILELAEVGGSEGLAVAQQLLAVSYNELDSLKEEEEVDNDDHHDHEDDQVGATTASTRITQARSLEQRLAALAANPNKYQSIHAKQQLLFGKSSINTNTNIKQNRRDKLAIKLKESTIPLPLNRLSTLIHQAIKWQAWTGQLPWIHDDNYQDSNNNIDNNINSKKRKHYDLILGRAAEDHGSMVGDNYDNDNDDTTAILRTPRESIPSQRVAKIKFGKSAVCEAATTLHNGIITASSDGFIEIWALGGSSSYPLNTTDYPYQAQDQVMGHDHPVLALSVSRDQTMLASGDSSGVVKIWRLDTGTCLRQYQAHPTTGTSSTTISGSTSITAMDWSPDGSKLLVASSAQGRMREFGIVSQQILQEYVGHDSYIQSCAYCYCHPKGSAATRSIIITSSTDGTVRVWNPQHGLCQAIWQPPQNYQSTTTTKTKTTAKNSESHWIGTSIVVDATSVLTESPSIVAACPVPSTSSYVVVVPRSTTAFLVDMDGIIVQDYSIPAAPSAARRGAMNKNEDDSVVFCAATVTADWVYLCTTGNDCLVFAVRGNSGQVVQTIRDFGRESTSPTTSIATVSAEISQLIYHPHKPILMAFSNDKTQKKGVLAVWK
jgi:WD40 repeat protein